jgi:hypothetical protein
VEAEAEVVAGRGTADRAQGGQPVAVHTGRTGFDGKSSAHVLQTCVTSPAPVPKAELISLKFSRFSFMVENNRKPEIDIVFDDIGFHGVLSFIEASRS